MDYKWSICKLVGIIQYMLDKMRHIFWVLLIFFYIYGDKSFVNLL